MDMEMKKNLATVMEHYVPGFNYPCKTSIMHNERLLNWLDEMGFLTEPQPTIPRDRIRKYQGFDAPTPKKDSPPEPEKSCQTCGWLREGPNKAGEACTEPERKHWKPKDEKPIIGLFGISLNPEAKEYPYPPHEDLCPRAEWDQVRLDRLKACIANKAQLDQEIPQAWTDEYNEIRRRLRG